MSPPLMAPFAVTPPATATTATALFKDDSGHYELQITVNSVNGFLTAILVTPNLDASGHSHATLVRVSQYSTILAATVAVNGYDLINNRPCDIEVSIGATWTQNRCDPAFVEVAGTALVTDLSAHELTSLAAVRHHPYNEISSVDSPSEPQPLSIDRPGTATESQNQHPLVTT